MLELQSLRMAPSRRALADEELAHQRRTLADEEPAHQKRTLADDDFEVFGEGVLQTSFCTIFLNISLFIG
jgi:hypothetical protein